MGKKFDMAAAFAQALGTDVSDSDTSRERIEYIPLDKLDADPSNFYALDGLDELAANIQLCGLQQPIRVRPSGDGRYTIVSGHRRRAALAILAQEAPERWGEAPCIVERDAASPELQELRLIYANAATRRLTDAEISRQAEEVERLLYLLKEQGYEFPGRMRDQVAAACKVSAPKLARLKVIREKLTASWAELFDAGNLPEQTAYALARMTEALQLRIYDVDSKHAITGGVAERILEASQAGATWEPSCACPDGSPCGHGAAMLRHDIADSFDMCKGQRCCLECYAATRSWSPCERMCAKAKARRKDEKKKADAKEERRKAKILKSTQQETQRDAQRLLRAIEAAGLDDREQLAVRAYGGLVSVSEIRDWAAGRFDGPRDVSINPLEPRYITHPAELARKLHCSTDYLLGVTDELAMPGAAAASAWHLSPEEPETEGYYWCLTGPLYGGGKLLYWAGQWELADVEAAYWGTVCAWTPSPTIPEEFSWYRAAYEQAIYRAVPPGLVSGATRPPQSGMYYCRFDCEGTGIRQLAYWDQMTETWRFSRTGERIDATCEWWFPLPGEEDQT